MASSPEAGLVQGADGSFYGTTSGGGGSNLGTVFEITSNGTISTLHSFTGTGSDGSNPYAGLVQGTDGSFYGTTSAGGSSNLGTVFRITSSGTISTLHSFTGTGSDGSNPYAGLLQGTDGSFYGTTYAGGSSNLGTVFEITSNGTISTLHSFTGTGSDGSYPYAGLVQGTDAQLLWNYQWRRQQQQPRGLYSRSHPTARSARCIRSLAPAAMVRIHMLVCCRAPMAVSMEQLTLEAAATSALYSR